MPSGFGNSATTKNTLIMGVWLVVFAFAAMFLYSIARILLLVFAGVLMAVFLSGCAAWISRRTRISYSLSTILMILAPLAFFGVTAWLVAPNIEEQFSQLRGTMQTQLSQLQQLGAQSQGYKLFQGTLEKVVNGLRPLERIEGWAMDAVVIVFVSVYLAFQPSLYRRGVEALIPPQHRKMVSDAMGSLGEVLWRWFLGRLVGMAVIGILVSVTMAAAGIPLAITLGIIAGVLEFVPYVGALVSSIPALLIAMQQGWQTVWLVLLLYLIIHAIDGYIVIPLVERKAVSIPPALTITVQLAMYITAGILGVLIADPLAACCLVLVKRFYLENMESSTPEQVPQEAHT